MVKHTVPSRSCYESMLQYLLYCLFHSSFRSHHWIIIQVKQKFMVEICLMYPRVLHVLWMWLIYLDPPRLVLFRILIYHVNMNYYLQTPSSIDQKLAIQPTKIMTNNKIYFLQFLNIHSRILTCKSILTILSVFFSCITCCCCIDSTKYTSLSNDTFAM